MSLRSLTRSLGLVAFTVFYQYPCSGQTASSTISGKITDASGAVVPAARVRVVNEQSGVATAVASNTNGLYHAASLSPGSYRIEIEKQGFQKLVQANIVLQVSQSLQLDEALQVGSVSETVAVTASAQLVESQTSAVSQLVERSMIEGMPLPNRSAAAMIVLSPGATVINAGSGGENLPIFSVGGGRARNQQFSLDGGNVTNITGLAVPQNQAALPMEAMQEFRVISNNYAAEYGHSTGGVITMSTRSGTNQFHGSLFEYLRNDALDARNFFSAGKPPLRLNQFGGALGGPIRKDRTHFFASWEQTRQTTGSTGIQTVPDERQRVGDFSQTFIAAGRTLPIYDPLTTAGNVRQPFAGNQIPANRIDAVARAAAAFWPLPNRPATVTGANNFVGNANPAFTRNIVVARLDHQFRPRDQVMVRYFINSNSTDNFGSQGKPESDSGAAHTDSHNSSILASETHLFSSNMIQEFRFARLRRFGGSFAYGLGDGPAAKLGLKGVTDQAFPIFNINGFVGLGREPSRINSRPQFDDQFQDSVSWFRGKHAIKLGMEARHGMFNDGHDVSSSGSFGFTPLITALPGVANTGNAFASFLLGEANSASTSRADEINSRAWYYAAYAQDDFRVSGRLTLNLGLRWEVATPRSEINDRMNSFDPLAINPVSRTPGVITFAGRNGVPRTAFDADMNNFGPRAGFAWRLPGLGATVVRGGGGVFFGESVSNIIGTAAPLGFSTDVDLVATQPGINSAMRLREGFPSVPRVPIDQLGPGFGAVAPGRAPSTAVTFFERNRPLPISYQYNLNIQHELRANFLLEAGYLANISHHLTANDLTLNQVQPQLLGPGDAQSRRPFPQFSNVSVINPPLGNSTYHAMTLKAEKRYSSGFTFLSHYTFSKFLDDVTSFSEFGNAGSYMDAYNRRLDKSLSGNDVRHRALISGVYELPALRKSRALAYAIGGWKTGVIASFQSGPVFSVTNQTNQTNAFPAGTVRPDLIGDPNTADRTLARWFNTDAFRAPAQFRFGNAGRSILRGDRLANVDLSLSKNFPIHENWKAEFRGEFFNLLNHADFGIPAAALGTPAFGSVNSARASRSVQLALRLSF